MTQSDIPKEAFYDRKYYESHYGHLLNRPGILLGEYYKRNVFDAWAKSAKDILDFGAGHGALTATVNADCHDLSTYALDKLRTAGRKVVADTRDLPDGSYDIVFSSHTLEHCKKPLEIVTEMRRLLKSTGRVILILPIETMPGKPRYTLDNDCHLYAWNFQNITNLLITSGFEIQYQSVFFAPFMLRTLGTLLNSESAVIWSTWFSRLRRQYPASLTVAALE